MATIKDVARKAGVSTATVSRVLNRRGYFDRETAGLVRRAATELGYRPNVNWKRLSRQSSETVCYLLGNSDTMNSMHVKVLMSAEQVLREAGYDLVFVPFCYRAGVRGTQLELPRLLQQQGTVDGVILAGVHYTNLLDALSRLNLPYVLLGNAFAGPKEKLRWDAVVYDDIGGSYEAVNYLVRLGHRRIAYVGNIALPWFRRRYEGYARVMRERELPEILVAEGWDVSNIEYGQLAVPALLGHSEPVTAVFAANDPIAAGIWRELLKRGILVPRDISLCGFGDREEFSIIEPSLTTVSVFQEKLGAEIASMLLRRLGKPGAHVSPQTFPCKLLERASCAAPSGAPSRP
ncbi:MAG: LacI family DNA-binding transcriptional regulator [Bryobacteraceae bacterium]|nr:LacI family transcriptional regulator [Bryobacterales bacterium]MEB2363082.1 LacI family DNA-binding transcriptional regulator [Bryobacterales bacterium]NUM99896.1 LacI family DNA-binding transcriptional regulator [Bryobacteraceae bacterium]